MPKNPFSRTVGKPPKLNRNAFDLSRNKLFTLDFGQIYPLLCEEVIPGDSFRIESAVGFRGMPTIFPLQTRIRASVSYFYVRNRTLYNEFEDFIFKTKEVTPPWLKLNNSRAKQMICTGSLGDALGVPSTIGSTNVISNRKILFDAPLWGSSRYSLDFEPSFDDAVSSYHFESALSTYFSNASVCVINSHVLDFHIDSFESFSFSFVSKPAGFSCSPITNSLYWRLYISDSRGQLLPNLGYLPLKFTLALNATSVTLEAVGDASSFVEAFNSAVDRVGGVRLSIVYSHYLTNSPNVGVFSKTSTEGTSTSSDPYVFHVIPPLGTEYNRMFCDLSETVNSVTESVSSITDATDDSVISSNPFVGDTPEIPLNVLPFRAYTMLCNYFFRNDLNNPYIVNGHVQYNQFIPTYDGGADTNTYDFYYKNWELDRFTSALQSPQFGVAPLVGLTYNGTDVATFKFQDTTGNEYEATAAIDLETGTITGLNNYSQDIPSGNLRSLVDMINYGISINDLRNVNSFQRFLENTMRRGLRYRNQLKSHMGVDVDYPDIDVPQYIGGYSGWLAPGQTTNVADSPDSGLGDFNGTIGGTISSSRSINCYCPEHGFIIGVVSLTPVPLYSQSIAKYLLKLHPFDYFQSEFSKIGFVPIHYSEVTPLQNVGNQSPSDVFGYQKAWYEYMSAVDEAHGDFRTTLQSFTLSRTFAQRPTLVEDFVRVKPDQLNQIFVTNSIADRYGSNKKFLCHCSHKISAVRPIPRNGTPSLE